MPRLRKKKIRERLCAAANSRTAASGEGGLTRSEDGQRASPEGPWTVTGNPCFLEEGLPGTVGLAPSR